MSRIDDLIDALSPSGVSFKALGDFATLVRGNGMPKTELTDAGVGAIHYGQIYTRYGVSTTSTMSFVAPETAEKLAKAQPGDIIITNTSENVEDVGKAVAWLGDEAIVTGGHATVIKHAEDPKYLSYWFQTDAFFKQKKALATGTKVIDVSAKQLAKVRIPLPPIAVQREVVRILDQFTQLNTELDAELQARTQQRLALTRILPNSGRIRTLTPNGVERVRIGDVATQFVAPTRVRPDETYVNLGVRWYGEGAFARDSKPGNNIKASTLYRVKPGQFIYNRMFVVEGSFGVITPDLADGVVSGEFPVYDLDPARLLPGWLMLYLLDEYSLKRVAAEVTGVERGSMKSRRRWKEEQFEAFQIELPSITAQREVLRVLGAGAALESALRQELVARRQQYEHYRDRLLTFEEALA